MHSLALFTLLTLTAPSQAQVDEKPVQADFVLENATLIDGSGKPGEEKKVAGTFIQFGF